MNLAFFHICKTLSTNYRMIFKIDFLSEEMMMMFKGIYSWLGGKVKNKNHF